MNFGPVVFRRNADTPFQIIANGPNNIKVIEWEWVSTFTYFRFHTILQTGPESGDP